MKSIKVDLPYEMEYDVIKHHPSNAELKLQVAFKFKTVRGITPSLSNLLIKQLVASDAKRREIAAGLKEYYDVAYANIPAYYGRFENINIGLQFTTDFTLGYTGDTVVLTIITNKVNLVEHGFYAKLIKDLERFK